MEKETKHHIGGFEMKEWNLSDKIWWATDSINGQHLWLEDVREFIRRREDNVKKLIGKRITDNNDYISFPMKDWIEFMKKRDKLAGDSLT